MDKLSEFWSEHIGRSFLADTKLEEAVHSGKGIELGIDGDIIAYRAAAACEGRLYEHPEIDGIKWKYKADADMYCDDNKLDKGKLKKICTPEPVSHAIKNIETTLGSILSHFEGSDVDMRIYLTGSDNFRCSLSETYKAHRVEERPFHLDACKEYLTEKYGAETVEGLEADDLMGIRGYHSYYVGLPYCICTTDKDLNGIPGNHYNWVTGEERVLTEAEADLFFYTQLLTGDKTDNIDGIKGCGPVGAAKILKEFHDDPSLISTKSLYKTVLNAYVEAEGKEKGDTDAIKAAVLNLTSQAQQLWILREKFVMWSPPDLSEVTK